MSDPYLYNPDFRTILRKLDLFPEAKWCSHGCPHARGGKKFHHRGLFPYPYTATAAFALERIVFHNMNQDPQVGDAAFHTYEDIRDSAQHTINEILLKSCVMMGTDLMRHSSTGEDIQAEIAKSLSTLILLMDAQTANNNDQGISHVVENFVDLDCPRNLVLFYDARNPCSCLDKAKEKHKTKMGRCSNHGCETYCLDSKLLTCSGCQMHKFCCKECQVACWPQHKVFCKEEQKKRQKEKAAAKCK